MLRGVDPDPDPVAPPAADPATAERSHRRHELVAAALLGLATVATAWSAYQARQWTGEQSQGYSRATAARIAVNRESAVASRQLQIDVATFIQWVNAHEDGHTALADFYRTRFRDEFKPAFDAWVATRPRKNPRAPLSPFAMPQYKLAASAEADRLEATAAAFSDAAGRDIQRADDYSLSVVLFAASLFFAGISTRLRSRGPRAVVVGLGYAVFLGTVIWLATFPVSVSV